VSGAARRSDNLPPFSPWSDGLKSQPEIKGIRRNGGGPFPFSPAGAS
jgi:hypothetical protein